MQPSLQQPVPLLQPTKGIVGAVGPGCPCAPPSPGCSVCQGPGQSPAHPTSSRRHGRSSGSPSSSTARSDICDWISTTRELRQRQSVGDGRPPPATSPHSAGFEGTAPHLSTPGLRSECDPSPPPPPPRRCHTPDPQTLTAPAPPRPAGPILHPRWVPAMSAP